MALDVVSTWFGVFLVDRDSVVRAYPCPADRAALRERIRLRHQGRLTREEEELLREHRPETLRARDRRFIAVGARPGRFDPPAIDPKTYGIDPAWQRELLLEVAREALETAWDPSVHVEEAVRALVDLESLQNVVGERLASWARRDAPLTPGELRPSLERLVETLRRGDIRVGDSGAGSDPALTTARRSLAEVYSAIRSTSAEMEQALTVLLPREAPNLTALLGPLLSARLIEKAGGLSRLARLPASTVQVLGAERAFFEHLRGRAPPPRHGLLFLHPDIQPASRSRRGKLARALAGKVAIAARLDQAGGGLDPELAASFRRRVEEIRSMGPGRPRPAQSRKRSVAPFHRAAQHR